MSNKKKINISLILDAFKNLEKSYIDIKKNISIPKDEFIANKLIQDKVRVDFNLAFESCMRPCRHLSVVYNLKTTSKDCLVKLGEFVSMRNVDLLKDVIGFYFEYRDLKKEVDPEYLYHFLEKHLIAFKDFAMYVIEFVKKETNNPLLIDFDLLNEKLRHIKDSISKIDFVLSQGFEEFKSKPMYYDRVKYFYQVAYDSLFDICKHLAPKFGIKKFGDDCLSKFIEMGIIDQKYYMDVFKMTNLKNKLISTWEVSPEELYETLTEIKGKIEPVTREISRSLRALLEKHTSNS